MAKLTASMFEVRSQTDSINPLQTHTTVFQSVVLVPTTNRLSVFWGEVNVQQIPL